MTTHAKRALHDRLGRPSWDFTQPRNTHWKRCVSALPVLMIPPFGIRGMTSHALFNTYKVSYAAGHTTSIDFRKASRRLEIIIPRKHRSTRCASNEPDHLLSKNRPTYILPGPFVSKKLAHLHGPLSSTRLLTRSETSRNLCDCKRTEE